MTEPSPVYYADLTPTPSELKLLARGRQLQGFALVDFDSMTIYPCRGPEHLNGKHAKTVEEMIIEARGG